MLAAVADSQAAAEVVKAEVMEVKDVAVKLVTVIAAETAVAEEKLAAAKPALDAAEAALQVIMHLLQASMGGCFVVDAVFQLCLFFLV